jgi:hypothetical protein
LSNAAKIHGEDKRSEIYPLDLLLPEDNSQIQKLTLLLGKVPAVIHYYLQEIGLFQICFWNWTNRDSLVYATVLHNQEIKLVASGHDLGSDILFSTRLGFSGTPLCLDFPLLNHGSSAFVHFVIFF